MKNEDRAIGKALKATASAIQAHGLDVFPLTIEIRNNEKPRTFGTYRHFPDEMDRIELTIPDTNWLDGEGVHHTLFHEVGHAVWEKTLRDMDKAKWIELYNAGVETRHVTKQLLDRMRNDLVTQGNGIALYRRGMDEIDREMLKAALQWIKKVRRLSAKDVDVLLKTGDDLTDIWPKTDVIIGSILETLTEYAKKNAEEFFAEAFALTLGEDHIPPAIGDEMEATLKNMQTRS